MDILHGDGSRDRRTPVGLESSSPSHHTAPLHNLFHQIESSYDRNEERRNEERRRVGGRRQNREGEDGRDNVDRASSRNIISSTSDGAVGGDSTTGDASRKRKRDSSITDSGDQQKKGKKCDDGTAAVEREGSIAPNNDGEDSVAAAGCNLSSFSTSDDDDGDFTGGGRRPLDDRGAIDWRSTPEQLVRAAINDNNEFEKREREFEKEYDSGGFNVDEYVRYMLPRESEEEQRYFRLRYEAEFGMHDADDDAANLSSSSSDSIDDGIGPDENDATTVDMNDDNGSSTMESTATAEDTDEAESPSQGNQVPSVGENDVDGVDFGSGGGDIVDSDDGIPEGTPSAAASSSGSDGDQLFSQIHELISYIESYLGGEDASLSLVSKNLNGMVGEAPSCDHCSRKCRTKAELTAHEEECHIKVGQAEDDDDAYFHPANDVFEEERDASALQAVVNSALKNDGNIDLELYKIAREKGYSRPFILLNVLNALPKGGNATKAAEATATRGEEAFSVVTNNIGSIPGYPATFQIMQAGEGGELFISRSAAIGSWSMWKEDIDEGLKDIVLEYGPSMLEPIRDDGGYLDLKCPFLSQIPRNFVKDAVGDMAVYAEFVLDNGKWVLKSLRKVGYSSNLLRRSSEYPDTSIIICLVHVDGMSVSVEGKVHAVLDKMMQAIIHPESKVSAPAKRFYQQLITSGALNYGPGRAFIGLTLENQISIELDTRPFAEYLRFPTKLRNLIMKELLKSLKATMDHPRLRRFFQAVRTGRRVDMKAMLNWAAGHNKLSSHVEMTKAAGFDDIEDALEALFPNAKDVEKMFCDDYNEDQLEGGRGKFRSFAASLLESASRGEYVFGLLNFYAKLFTWPQLLDMILSAHEDVDVSSDGFNLAAHVFHNPSSTNGLPSELVIFESGTVLLVVVKSWSSAADSSGRISSEQCLSTGLAVDFVTNLASAMKGELEEPSYVAIEGSIGKVHLESCFHQSKLVGSAYSRQNVTPADVNAFAKSDLKHSPVYSRAALLQGLFSEAKKQQHEWRGNCFLTNGSDLSEGIENLVSYCGDNYGRWIDALIHFRGFEEVTRALRERCPIQTSLQSMETHLDLVQAGKAVYDEKRRWQRECTVCVSPDERAAKKMQYKANVEQLSKALTNQKNVSQQDSCFAQLRNCAIDQQNRSKRRQLEQFKEHQVTAKIEKTNDKFGAVISVFGAASDNFAKDATGHPVVSSVQPGGIFAEANLGVGMVLISVNGIICLNDHTACMEQLAAKRKDFIIVAVPFACFTNLSRATTDSWYCHRCGQQNDEKCNSQRCSECKAYTASNDGNTLYGGLDLSSVQEQPLMRSNTSASGYRGVRERKGRWQASISTGKGKAPTTLGTFDTVEEAARIVSRAAHYLDQQSGKKSGKAKKKGSAK